MTKLQIRKYGDPVLRKKCKPVTEINEETYKLIRDMLETLYDAPGIGLAANQVGAPVKICVIDMKPEGRRQPLILINPSIISRKGKAHEEEGCLSFPGLSAKVRRAGEVRVEAVNERGLPIVVEGRETMARCLQHEIDHLEGKVFLDYLPFLQKLKVQREIKKRKKEGTW
jgi:peptide deformylase